MPGPILRLYSEFIPAETLARADVLAGLREIAARCRARGVEPRLVLQIFVPEHELGQRRPKYYAPFLDVLAAVPGEADLPVVLWPQHYDREAVFLNVLTAPEFYLGVVRLADWLQKALPGPLPEFLFDLEPEKHVIAAMFARRPAALWGLMRHEFAARHDPHALARVMKDLRTLYGIGGQAAIFPQANLRSYGRLAQRVLGTPLRDESGAPVFDSYAVMAYGSLLDGLGAGRFTPDRRRTVRAWVRQNQRAWGERGQAAILGMIATGILDTEPLYPAVAEFLGDFEAVAALGVRDIGIYSLSGLLFPGTRASAPRPLHGPAWGGHARGYTARRSEFTGGAFGYGDLLDAMLDIFARYHPDCAPAVAVGKA